MSAAFRTNSGRGSRSVASYDEDASTMGVEAARIALRGNLEPKSLWFSTTHPPILDKGSASTMSAVLGMSNLMGAYDVGGSIRSSFGAIRLASNEKAQSLVVLSDLRFGKPGSDDEINGGDGSAAFTFSEDPAVEIIDIVSETSPVMDRWRTEGSIGSQVWDDRWTSDQQVKSMISVANQIMAKNSMAPSDFSALVVSSASPRASASVSTALKISSQSSEQINQFGFLGSADLGVRLAWTLENSEPGQKILVITGADGADAMILETNEKVIESRVGMPLVGRSEEIDVATYLIWRELVSRESSRRPDPEAPSAPVASRNHEWKFGFFGSQCTECDSRQLPPQRICMKCGSIDQSQKVLMSDMKATIKTFTIDRIAFSMHPPTVVGVIDFDGGGRFRCQLTEVTPDKVKVSDRVEMVYRLISIAPNGVRNYFWKARPTEEVL